MLGASERQLIRHVLIPSALTWIFSSLHISIGFAIIAVVVGEYLGSSKGIGYMISYSGQMFQTDTLLVGVIVVAAAGMLLTIAGERVRRHFQRWRPEHVGGR